ncbi:MAG TPA: beta-1,6-N-acetylglucosaminyltransferase [Aequorivita sp.]|nr:beta-1,6-N-acetylglucosaminyltransferase [Aequorivita sp.]
MKNKELANKPTAYLILAHTDPKQLFALVQSLDYQSDIFIHVDKKSDLSDFKKYSFGPSVHFISERVKVSWAGFNMVIATLNLIKTALETGEKYSHFVLLSGLDYPIKPIRKLHQFLNQNQEREFIRFIRVEDSPDHYLKIFRRHSFKNPIFPEVAIPMLNTGVTLLDKVVRKSLSLLLSSYKKAPLKNITPCYGSQWWAITPACAAYILDFVSNNPDFMRYFKTAFAPDEYFFHTIVGNSPFLSKSTGFQKYEGRGTFRMANLHVIHPSLSHVYTDKDFEELKNSDKFFVRKVTSASSEKLISKIDEELISLNNH